ncbi:protein of unknown function [Methylorubrum extorquens DM4]|uniref:Uncharacterized protein n=1 Tax=Methylorubrum extorquens (strain DSM 6343 / CIP 106787 / DM4) TaxID=661410 RepID=C7C7X2_METED|nr:hypothetical protein [Methylorubrum extorquens]CAX21901.1 protein of unknown function [Methylorubrum extorquens DM4]
MRLAGRVVGRVPAIALRDVTLRSSNAARLRCLRLGTRDVHAWARGIPIDAPRPAEATRFRYRLAEPGFRLADGAILTAAAAAWFEADGPAWCLASPGATLLQEGRNMVTLTRYPGQAFDLAHIDTAGLLDEWELRPVRQGDGYVLHGVDERGLERETGCVQGLDTGEGWAFAGGTGLVRLGSPRHALPTAGVTL